MTAWYNENDPFAAGWLRELIAEGLIAPGDVDERSIEDVKPDDLRPYTQCHFFAGIGIWSLALRRAGWPDDRPVWTGSCPCQPFSTAGKGGGFADERHLWPAFHWLIGQCRPGLVLGEQVASKDGLAWLDLVQADMETSRYAFGAVDLCAAGFGAPHIRQRSFWVADAGRGANERCGRSGEAPGAPSATEGETSQRERGRSSFGASGSPGRLADASTIGHDGRGASEARPQLGAIQRPERLCDARGMGLTNSGGSSSGSQAAEGMGYRSAAVAASGADRPSPINGLWRDADWLGCTDGKWRPVEPGTFPLVNAGIFRNRVGLLRGAGNSINLAVATGLIESVMDYLRAKELFDE